MLNAQTNSYSLLIRDGVLERMKMLPFFQGFHFSRTKQLQVQPENIPHAACYMLPEQMGPDGDPNTGHPRFIHTLNLGFSIVIQNNDPDFSENILDQAFWAILNGIVPDPGEFMTSVLRDATLYRNDNFMIEAFSKGSRRHNYGSKALDNEMPVAELQLELTCTYRADYPPFVYDDFRLLHQETFPEGHDTGVLRIISNYFLWPETGLTLSAPEFGTPALT